jgi:hypothetical protein
VILCGAHLRSGKGLLCSFLLLLESVETSLLGLVEVVILALVFTEAYVGVDNIDSGVGLGQLVVDTLDFVLLHFLGNGGAQVLRAVINLILTLLLLNFNELILNSKFLAV